MRNCQYTSYAKANDIDDNDDDDEFQTMLE